MTANQIGKVCLVGAGPGDPGLITSRGLELLRRADVVVYDALANPLLLDEAPAEAKRLYVGKRGGQRSFSQDEINQLLVDEARGCGLVVRLKGGDPYLFGRGAEEAAYLARHGIDCEVVPGVTAGIAVPAAAGIPVTHRQVASTVTFVTGHEDLAKGQSSVDYEALAGLIKSGGTVCFYMGVGRLGAISDELRGAGLAEDVSLAVVQWGTLPQQRHVCSTLGSAADDVAAAGIGSPAIIVVGKVVGIDEPGLDYFTRRPLFGQRIVITRTRQQASDLRRQLDELGATTLEAPTIELVEPDDWAPIDAAIRDVAQYDWLVLTSVNGVAVLDERLRRLGFDSRHLAGVKVAAIGDATAQAVREKLGIGVDLMPERFVAEALAQELIDRHGVTGQRMLLLRADIARPVLPRLLDEAGAEVTELAVYQTKLVPALPEQVLAAMREGQVDWVTFTSSSTAKNMVELLGDERSLLDTVKIASIGPITSETIRGLGLTVTVEAGTSNIGGLVEALAGAAVVGVGC